MANDGPDFEKWFNKATEFAKSYEWKPQDAWKAAPVIGLGLYMRRPLGFFAATAGLAYLAGPKVLEEARGWAVDEIKKRRNKPD